MNLRQTNMRRRRVRILEAARELLVNGGYDALTTRRLATVAGVTVPTIYNLIGGKDAVLRALIVDATETIASAWALPDEDASLDDADAWLTLCCRAIAERAQENRATMIASDRVLGLYSSMDGREGSSGGAAAGSISMATRLSQALQASGLLRGQISAHTLGQQTFICFRDVLRDWCYDVISMEEFERRFSLGLYIALCADATESTRHALVARISRLEKPLSEQDKEPAVQATSGASS